MGRIREIWSARFANIGTRMIHTTEMREGVSTFVDAKHVVYLSLRLDRDENRIVSYDMSPQDARFLAHHLSEHADIAESRND